mmetsp:Transcript_43289/g.108150  ORF Transcript_43289/g.108150 Transcript_43289/m.108150 type:complete len:205 (+) Transcript_43289:106-720(+)
MHAINVNQKPQPCSIVKTPHHIAGEASSAERRNRMHTNDQAGRRENSRRTNCRLSPHAHPFIAYTPTQKRQTGHIDTLPALTPLPTIAMFSPALPAYRPPPRRVRRFLPLFLLDVPAPSPAAGAISSSAPSWTSSSSSSAMPPPSSDWPAAAVGLSRRAVASSCPLSSSVRPSMSSASWISGNSHSSATAASSVHCSGWYLGSR